MVLDEPLFEKLWRDAPVFFQNPGEHHPDEVAQHGPPHNGVAPPLEAARPLVDFAVELLAQGGGCQRLQHPVGVGDGGGLPQQTQQLVGGGAGRGRGQPRIERHRHIDLPGGANGHPRLQTAVRGDGVSEQQRRFGRPGLGENSGA